MASLWPRRPAFTRRAASGWGPRLQFSGPCYIDLGECYHVVSLSSLPGLIFWCHCCWWHKLVKEEKQGFLHLPDLCAQHTSEPPCKGTSSTAHISGPSTHLRCQLLPAISLGQGMSLSKPCSSSRKGDRNAISSKSEDKASHWPLLPSFTSTHTHLPSFLIRNSELRVLGPEATCPTALE